LTSVSVFVIALGVVSLVAALQSFVGSARYLGYARLVSRPRAAAPGPEFTDVTLIVPCTEWFAEESPTR